MPKLKIESLREGMVLADDVKNAADVLLLPAGAALTARHISMFGSWEIKEVAVEACDDALQAAAGAEGLSPEARRQIESELQAVFWEPVHKNPVQAHIYKLALDRKARQFRSANPAHGHNS